MLSLMRLIPRPWLSVAALLGAWILIAGLARATVSTTASSTTAQGNGVTTSFSYAFEIPNAGDAVVQVTDTTQTPNVVTTLTATQYTITGLGSATGGTVTPTGGAFTYPLASGYTITVSRLVPLIQSTSLCNQGITFCAIEGALDYLTFAVQQVQTEVSVIQSQITAGTANLLGYVAPFDSIQVLRSNQIAYAQVSVASYYGAATGGSGGGNFQLRAGTCTDDGGTVIVDAASHCYYREIGNTTLYPASWFGAKCDATTDDTTALTDAYNAVPTGGGVQISGVCDFTALTLSRNVFFDGNGFWTTSINAGFGGTSWTDTTKYGGSVLRCTSTSGVCLTIRQIANTNGRPAVNNVLVLGPGSGSEVCIEFGDAPGTIGGAYSQSTGLGVANCSTDIDLGYTQYVMFNSPYIAASNIGVDVVNVNAATIIFNNATILNAIDYGYLDAVGANGIQFNGGFFGANVSGAVSFSVTGGSGFQVRNASIDHNQADAVYDIVLNDTNNALIKGNLDLKKGIHVLGVTTKGTVIEDNWANTVGGYTPTLLIDNTVGAAVQERGCNTGLAVTDNSGYLSEAGCGVLNLGVNAGAPTIANSAAFYRGAIYGATVSGQGSTGDVCIANYLGTCAVYIPHNSLSVVAGGGKLANTATSGFLYAPTTTSGLPSGTPATVSGFSPIVIDVTDNKVCFWNGSAWKCALGS